VLHVIDSLTSGGAQRQLATLLGALDRRDVTSSVAVYHRHDHFRPDVESTGASVHDLGGRGGRDPRVVAHLASLLKSTSYDLVHSWLLTPGVLARVAASLAGGPAVIVSERNVDLGASPARMLLERALARRARLMIVNADAIARNVEERLPVWRGRVRVVHNGFRWTAPSDDVLARAAGFRAEHASRGEFLLAVVGRVERQKAPLVLLDALELLPDEALSRVRTVWVGRPIDRDLFAEVVERAGFGRLADRFEMVPETRDVRSVYLGADAVVLPSRWEGFPNALLEALGNARPVIATDVGDADRLAIPGSTGWLVPPEDALSLAGAISQALSAAPGALVEMGERGAALVRESYSDRTLAERTLAVYEEALTG